jgi:hypothetical protein
VQDGEIPTHARGAVAVERVNPSRSAPTVSITCFPLASAYLIRNTRPHSTMAFHCDPHKVAPETGAKTRRTRLRAQPDASRWPLLDRASPQAPVQDA